MRGTVKIEQKVERYKDKPDMLPIVVRTCYDGDQFAELDFFKSSIVPEQAARKKQQKTEEDFIMTHMKK